MQQSKTDLIYFRTAIIVSVLIPVVVALLFFARPQLGQNAGPGIYFLPKLNAMINATVSVLLLAGFILIKQKNRTWHKTMMVSAFALSALFLVSYVSYHLMAERTSFGGEGWLKSFYLFILLTHVLLAIVIVPMVLFTIYYSSTGKFEQHKKIARFTFPVWLYVSITGVLVYLLISPYYPY